MFSIVSRSSYQKFLLAQVWIIPDFKYQVAKFKVRFRNVELEPA